MLIALNALSKQTSRPLDKIPATPDIADEIFGAVMNSGAGWSPSQRKRTRNFIRRAMYIAGVPDCRVWLNPSQSKEWLAVWSTLDGDQFRLRLARLRQYCLAHQISPKSVDDRIIGEFAHWLTNRTDYRKPKQIHHDTCLWWNRAADRFPNWPQTRLTVPSRQWPPTTWSTFPDTLERDVNAFVKWKIKNNGFGERRRINLSDESIRRTKEEIRRFAHGLVQSGYPAALFRQLSDIVRPNVVRDGLRYLINRKPPHQPSYIYVRALELRMIAKRWVRIPEGELSEFDEIIKAVRPEALLALKSRELRRLRVFDDRHLLARLLHLPVQLLNEAIERDDGRIKWAKQVQIALGIELLLCYPLWVRTLCMLQFDTTTPRPGAVILAQHLGRPLTRMTSNAGWELPMPPNALRLLNVYLRDFRSRLVRTPSKWVFPNGKGKAIPSYRLSRWISEAIRRRIGIDAPTSLFRHFAAKVLLESEPGAYEAVRQLLGLKRVFNARAIYRSIDAAAAFQRFDSRVLKLSPKGAKRLESVR